MTRFRRLQTGLRRTVAWTLVGGASPCLAQGLITDRPDFTESAVVVSRGSLQFEGGGSYTRYNPGSKQWVIGEPLFRLGVNDRVELRVGPPSLMVEADGDDSGFSDGSIGAKIQLGPVGDAWDLAAIVSTSIPIGDRRFSSDAVDPMIVVVTGRALNESVNLGAQVIAAAPTVGSDRRFEWGATCVLSSSLGTDLGGFAEIAVTIPESGSAPVVGHTGFVYTVSESVQVDLHGGVGLNHAAPDSFIGAGLAVRIR